MLRFDHVGVVVDDLDAAAAFFIDLGFEREGGTLVEGDPRRWLSYPLRARRSATGSSGSASTVG